MNNRRNQISADNKEYVNTDKTTAKEFKASVKKNNWDNGDGS